MRQFNVPSKSLIAAIGAAFALSSIAAESPLFQAKSLDSGYMIAADDKAHEGKCGEAKCGADKKAAEEKKAHEGKCGEGKCGADKKKEEGKGGADKT